MKIKSIKTRIILASVALIIFFGSIATGAVYFVSKNVLERVKEQDFLFSTTLQTYEARNVFFQSNNLVRSIAENQSVIDFLSSDQENRDSQSHEHLVEHKLLHDYNIGQMYSAIYLMDKNGLTLLSTDESFIGNNYGFRDYFQSAVNGRSYADVSVGVTSKKLGYYFSYPVETSEGEIVGVAVVKQAPDLLHESVVNQHSNSQTVMLVDQFGVVIHSNDPQRIFKSLGPLSDDIQQQLKQKKRYAENEIKSLEYALVLADLGVLARPKSFIFAKEQNQPKKLLTLAQIEGLPFYIVGETNFDEIGEFAMKSARIIAFFVIFAAIFAALVIFLIINRLLKPISHLVLVATTIAEGDLKQRANIDSEDEFGQLARAFNLMADQLILARDKVKKQSEVKISELEELNSLMVDRELKMEELKNENKKITKELRR